MKITNSEETIFELLGITENDAKFLSLQAEKIAEVTSSISYKDKGISIDVNTGEAVCTMLDKLAFCDSEIKPHLFFFAGLALGSEMSARYFAIGQKILNLKNLCNRDEYDECKKEG